MLLNAVIICSLAIVNAESPLNNYSISGDNNGYNNAVTNNGYLGTKDGYQNSANFYNTDDTSQKLSNYVSTRSLINSGNQGSIGSDIGNIHNGYSVNDHRNEYSGYSNTYENPNTDSYSLSSHAASRPFRGSYTSDINNNAESILKGYSSDSIHKDSDFGQYADSSVSNTQRIPAYPGYSKPVTDNYYGNPIDNNLQGYHGFSDSASYSDGHHVYSPYSSGMLDSEYLFGKQKDGSYNLKSNKYNDIHPMPSGMRYMQRYPGYMTHNHGVSYLSAGPSNHVSKVYGPGIYSLGKPNKYGYKYSSRYAPNSGVTYFSKERDGHYAPHGKGSGKVIMIKKNRPSYSDSQAYPDESHYIGDSGYSNKNGGFLNGIYSISPNFNGYNGRSSNNYDDGPTMSRRYKPNNGQMVLQKTVYS